MKNMSIIMVLVFSSLMCNANEGGFDKANLAQLKKAFPEIEIDSVTSLDVKNITNGSLYCALVLKEEQEEGDINSNFGINLVLFDSSKKIIAKSSLPDSFVSNTSISCDTAPYKLSENELLYGIRISNYYSSTSHNTSSTTLDLYRKVNDTLINVFNIVVLSSSTEKLENTNQTDDSKSIVIVTNHKTNNSFDLKIKTETNSKEEPNDDADKTKVKLSKPEKTKTEKIYTWDGSKYITKNI